MKPKLSKFSAVPMDNNIYYVQNINEITNFIYAHMANARNAKAIPVLKIFAIVYAPNNPKTPEQI